jgi:hypothetical protein
MWFKRKIDLKMVNPSSKMSLKMSCLMACKNNVGEAERLYKFLSEGIETLPDFDTPIPNAFEQIKQGVGQAFGWFKENKDDIMNAVGYLRSMRGGTPPVEPTEPLPPLKPTGTEGGKPC